MDYKVQISESFKENDSAYVVNNQVGICNGQYGIWDNKKEKDSFIPMGSAVYLSEVITRIDTGQKYLKLYFFDAQGKRIEIEFPRKELTELGIMQLLEYGVQVTKSTCKTLITSILNQEIEATYYLEHKKLGFLSYNKKLVFLGKEAVGIESEYEGNLQIGEYGDYTVWKKMVEKYILGYTPLEFMLAVGGSGVLVDYLRDKVQVENILVHLIGESSSGKSTAGLFMVSCGAKPSFQGNSLVLNFSDTPNAIMASIQSAFPVLIDEGSLCNYNPTNFLYSLSMGKEKKRLTKELEKADSAYFSTAIAITSEKSLLDLSGENTGLLVRNIEMQGVEWTPSAETADIIKSTIQTNYGFLIPRLAKEILRMEEKRGKEFIVSEYQGWQEYLIKEAKERNQYNEFTQRVCKQIALIFFSAELIQKVMGVEFLTDVFSNFVIERTFIGNSTTIDIGKRALEYLQQYISKYYSQFIMPEDKDYIPNNCLGRIKKVKKVLLESGEFSEKRLYIQDINLKKILQEGNFPDMKVILKRWKAQGYLQCEKDRFISNVNIWGDMTVKGYMVNLPCGNSEENI